MSTSKHLFAAAAVLVFSATGAIAQDQPAGGMGQGQGGGRQGGGMMARYDTDSDGKVSLAEFEAGRANQFKRMDSDSNGSVSFAEIDAATAQAAARGGPMADAMKTRMDALKAADTNADQSISADEYKAYADAEFKKLDTNADGSLSADELQAGMGGGRRQ